MKKLRILFMGTPDFAVSGLKALVESGETIVGVVTAPDRPAGRGRKMNESAVKTYAESIGLTVLQPINLKATDFIDQLKNLNADLQIVVAFRMLPKIVWQMPTKGTFNLHASLLPDYRGAAPINWAIINGERKTGVTTFFIDEKIDTGSIILKKEVFIEPHENAGDLHDKLMHLGSTLIVETVELIKKGNVNPEPQTESNESHGAPKLDRVNTQIDWQKPVDKIYDMIRGLSPYPVAWSQFINDGQENEMKIYAAHIAEETENVPKSKEKSIVARDGKIVVKCKGGSIVIDEVQLPGKRKMSTKDLLNGFTFSPDAKVR